MHWKCFYYKNTLRMHCKWFYKKCIVIDFIIRMHWKSFYNKNSLQTIFIRIHLDWFYYMKGVVTLKKLTVITKTEVGNEMEIFIILTKYNTCQRREEGTRY